MKPIIILSVLTLLLSACATHYIPSTCPTPGKPPVMSQVEWVRVCIVNKCDPNDKNCVVKKTCLPPSPKDESNLRKEQFNQKMKDEYINRCDKLGNEKPDK